MATRMCAPLACFLLALLLYSLATRVAEGQFQPQLGFAGAGYPQIQRTPYTYNQPQAGCIPCPPTLFDGSGSTRAFKATIIIQECPPCPPGVVPSVGVGAVPSGLPAAGPAGYVGNLPQQPPLTGQFANAQQPLAPFGGLRQQPYPFQQPITQPQYNPAYSPSNQVLGLPPGQIGRGFGVQSPLAGQYAPPGTLSSGYPPPGGLTTGGYGVGRGGYQPGPQQGALPIGSYAAQQYPISPFGMPSGGLLGPQTGGPLRADLSQAGGQPGYLPNYRGDRYTDPARIQEQYQETRALNQPFFDSIGGEPKYQGGADIPTPSQLGGNQPRNAMGRE